jgi:ATP-dependent RNA helicase SUPV3L1/SUV3
MPADQTLPAALFEAIGFPRAGCRAVRADVLERIAQTLRRAARRGPFELTERVQQWLSCGSAEVASVVEALGYRAVGDGRWCKTRRGTRHKPAQLASQL